MVIVPVILCGGSGTRLWPASTPTKPKQFAPLTSPLSSFQQTVLRVAGLKHAAPPLIVAGMAHARLARQQLDALGVEATLLLEPQARDSAPAIAAAAAWVARRDPAHLALVVASDHHIGDPQMFCDAVELASPAAADGAVVTFGVRPTHASSAYGYIQPGAALNAEASVFRVQAFVEKPDAAAAQQYLDRGFLWNSGNFLFQAATLISELERHAPAVVEAAKSAVATATRSPGTEVLGESFKIAPKVSIDYAVMEKTDRAAVAPVSFAWSDLGAWDAVLAASPQDADGNAGVGETVLIDTQGCLVRAGTGTTVVTLGVRDLAVVVEAEGILVCDLEASQGVKGAVERVQALRAARPPADPIEADLLGAARRLRAWLHASALPLWWSIGADHRRGGFHELLGQDGTPVDAPRRARVQARQTFVYAKAGEMGWQGPWRAAVEHGIDYFLMRYRRPDGRFRALVAPDGSPLDDGSKLYDQAFALLALSHAAMALPHRADLGRAARALTGELKLNSRHPAAGFQESPPSLPNGSNPHMHLFEAAMAYAEADPEGDGAALADEVGALCLSRFIDAEGGFLREFFAADWSPAEGIDGRIVEPGHQFEWAWLLTRWGVLRRREDALQAARRLYQIGTESGIDGRRGVAIAALLDDRSVHDAEARLWPQTERIKAAVALSELPGVSADERRVRLGEAAESAAALERYLDVPVPGLWVDRIGPDNRPVEQPAPASSFYHIIGAVAEMERWAATLP